MNKLMALKFKKMWKSMLMFLSYMISSFWQMSQTQDVLQLFPISWEGLVWMRKWLSHCMLLSWQARVSDWIYTSQLPECQGTPCSKETRYLKFKGALSSLRPFLAAENPLRMIKNAFYFMSKALFVLKISKFLSWLFGHVTKRFNKKNNVNFTFYDVRAWLTNNCNIHIAQHLEK